MSTESTDQVATSSIDRPGVSVATASRNARSARAGVIYDQNSLAAAQPIWFHPTPGGSFLTLFSRRLTSATTGGFSETGTMLYQSATLDGAPSWAVLNPATGSRGPVQPVPSRKPGTRTLTAAISRGEYLFTLNLHQAPGSNQVNALLQHFRVTPRDSIILEEEEFVPNGLGLGLWADRSHIWVFGKNDKNEMGLARKNWGRIGTNRDPNATRNWQYRGLDGWYSDPKKMASIPGPNDRGLPADGPCSVGQLRDKFYLAATAKIPAVQPSGENPYVPARWQCQIYTTRQVNETWSAFPGDAIPLGDEDTYQGGGVYLQPQLGLSRGFSQVVTSSGVTLLRPTSHHVQVFTGSAPQTVVLPAVAKVLGTVTNPDGSVTVPEQDADLEDPTSRIPYMPYTIHNQSTADVTVISSDREPRTVTVPHGSGIVFTPYSPTPTSLLHWSWAFTPDRAPRGRAGFPYVRTVGLGTTADGTPEGDFTLRTSWSFFDPISPATPAVPETPTPPAPPSTEAADPELLRELIKRFAILVNSVTAGTLLVSVGVVSTVTGVVLNAVTALTGDDFTDDGAVITALSTDLLQNLATNGATTDTAGALESLLRQITGGTGLTGGVVQGTSITTPLDFVQQVITTGGEIIGDVIEALAGLFTQLVNAITGR